MLSRKCYGVALIEFALVLPILVTLIFGTIEMGWLLFVRSEMTDVVYSGALSASSDQTQTNATVTSAIQSSLQSFNIPTGNAQITITPSNINGANRGDAIAVTVAVPASDVTIINFPIDMSGTNISVSNTMAKQY